MALESHIRQVQKSTDNYNQSPQGLDACASFLAEIFDDAMAKSLGSETVFKPRQDTGTETFKLTEAPKSYLPEASLTADYFDFSRKSAA